ncbi:MAG: rhomboid family intramembrane serine protease [Gammaproteobacteria bacterium]
MIIIPLEKSVDWKRPPLVTLLLIIACSVILFAAGRHDNQKYAELFDFYFTSVLPRLELPAYIATQDDKDDKDLFVDAKTLREWLDNDFRQLDAHRQFVLQRLLLRMQDDKAFMTRLHGGQVVTADNAAFNIWQADRLLCDTLIFEPVNKKYGFTPSEHRPLTFFSYMFLHDGIGHLFGNMLFLFLVGCTVEMALGSVLYLLCYVLTGLAAVGLFWAFNPAGTLPLVGASGAIAGIMGMYAGIFGLRKIRFFYSLLFYFDYVQAPALIMLPAWVANELYQMWSMPESNVAFMAHVGGLLSGGLLALVLQRFLSASIDTEYLDAGQREADKMQRYNQALRALGELNIPKAAKLFQALHAEYPQDRDIFWQLYKTLKHDPGSAEFQRILGEVLSLNDNDVHTLKRISEAFGYYVKAPPGKIPLDAPRLYNLAMRFAKYGYPENAELIVLNLLRKDPAFADLSKALLALASAWRQRQNRDKYAQAVALLRKHFPDSREARQLQLFAQADQA